MTASVIKKLEERKTSDEIRKNRNCKQDDRTLERNITKALRASASWQKRHFPKKYLHQSPSGSSLRAITQSIKGAVIEIIKILAPSILDSGDF